MDQGRFQFFKISAGLSYGFELSDNFSLGTGLRFICSSLADGSVSGQDINPGQVQGLIWQLCVEQILFLCEVARLHSVQV